MESLPDVLRHCLALRDGQWIHSTLGECGSRQQIDRTVPWAMWGQTGCCLLAEDILVCHKVRWDRGYILRFETFDERGADLGVSRSREQCGNRGGTILVASLAPASNFTGIPSDIRRVLVQPGASQDDVHGGSLQYQKSDGFLMQASNLKRHRERHFLGHHLLQSSCSHSIWTSLQQVI